MIVSPPNRAQFYIQVWEIVRLIPHGQVMTYGQIAAILPTPEGVSERAYRAQGPRWVGRAMAQAPGVVPWQRVVNASGKISPRKSGGHHIQRHLLRAEGIVFDEQDRIDLDQYLWRPTSEELRNSQQSL